MATITRINPDGISKPLANYSHVVTAQGAQKLVFCAGQVAADVDGSGVVNSLDRTYATGAQTRKLGTGLSLDG